MNDKNLIKAPVQGPDLAKAYREELDKLSQRNYELRMENADLKATPHAAQPATEESSADLINSMRETMRHQSQVITDLRQQIEILNEKISQKENEMNENTQQTQSTTPTHSWGVVTETADGGFNGRPETQDNEYVKMHPLSDSTDALRWATEFANKFTVWSNDGVEPDTKGLMIAWFANAIMAGVDNATRHEQSKYVELHQLDHSERTVFVQR